MFLISVWSNSSEFGKVTIFSVIQGYCFLKPATAVAKPFFSEATVQGCQTVRVTGVWLVLVAVGELVALLLVLPQPAANNSASTASTAV